ncbi:MAG: FlgD immunoglobulin-like domain containing protein, partial [Armatimonadota bacterium]
GGARHFRLEVSRGQDAALTVTGLSAVPNRGRGAQISFNLSVPASVRADIVNVAGRVIATLSSQGTVAAGRAYLTWDGTNKAGAIVPPGTYLVRVTAADEDGQRARGVTALLLGR